MKEQAEAPVPFLGPRQADFRFARGRPEFADRVLDVRATSACGREADGAGPSGRQKDRSSGRKKKKARQEGLSEGAVTLLRIPVSSVVLALQSDMFHKLFSSGMLESRHKDPVILHIEPQDKVAFEDLIEFMYSGSLPPHGRLLQLLLLSDRFIAHTCAAACASELAEGSFDLVTACSCLDLPESLRELSEVKKLVKSSQRWLAEEYVLEELLEAPKKAFDLPLIAIKSVLTSDSLCTVPEEVLFKATLAWFRHNRQDLADAGVTFDDLLPLIKLSQIPARRLQQIVHGMPEMKSLVALQQLANAEPQRLSLRQSDPASHWRTLRQTTQVLFMELSKAQMFSDARFCVYSRLLGADYAVDIRGRIPILSFFVGGLMWWGDMEVDVKVLRRGGRWATLVEGLVLDKELVSIREADYSVGRQFEEEGNWCDGRMKLRVFFKLCKP